VQLRTALETGNTSHRERNRVCTRSPRTSATRPGRSVTGPHRRGSRTLPWRRPPWFCPWPCLLDVPRLCLYSSVEPRDAGRRQRGAPPARHGTSRPQQGAPPLATAASPDVVPSFPIGSPLRRPRWPGSSHTVRVYGGVRLNLSRRHTQVSSYIVSLLSFVRLQLPGIRQCFSSAASPRDEKVGRDPLCFTTLVPSLNPNPLVCLLFAVLRSRRHDISPFPSL